MATTAVTLSTIPDNFIYSTTGLEVTFTAADVANGNHVNSTKPVAILANNTGGSAYTVTITSVASSTNGRTGDVSAQSLAAGEIRLFWLTSDGWLDSSSSTYLISANNAAVEFAAWERT
jgi:hypothetical protein